MKENSPGIAITGGDPSGIGYEIICKLFLHYKNINLKNKIYVIGNYGKFKEIIIKNDLPLKVNLVNSELSNFKEEENLINLININSREKFIWGKPTVECARVAIESINKSIEYAKKGIFEGIVTAPVNKFVISRIVKNFSGHTEYLAKKFKVKNITMIMASNKINVALVTTHLKLKTMVNHLTIDKVYFTIKNAIEFIKVFKKEFKIAVTGLNPHAGDNGLLGKEEESIIIPAIKKIKKEFNIEIEGPFPADSFFARYCKKRSEYDIIVAMYHDQGLIPFKMLSFNRGVNITWGLPVIRTSVDHGTAYDIAGKFVADYKSLKKALDYAVRIIKFKKKMEIQD